MHTFRHALLPLARGERGATALDMCSYTGDVVLPPCAEDIVAAAVAESDDRANMDALAILHVIYADGVERIATGALAEVPR